MCRSIKICGALYRRLVTSPDLLHAVVRTEEGYTFPYSFTDKELNHTCGNGRFPCASSLLFIEASFCF